MAIYTGGAHDLWSKRNLSVTKTWVIHPVSGGSFYTNTLWGQNSKSGISSYVFIKLISLQVFTKFTHSVMDFYWALAVFQKFDLDFGSYQKIQEWSGPSTES